MHTCICLLYTSKIREKIKSGEIVFTVDDEDIHMGIESKLIAEIGDVGKKLHTARSRNDQCQEMCIRDRPL